MRRPNGDLRNDKFRGFNPAVGGQPSRAGVKKVLEKPGGRETVLLLSRSDHTKQLAGGLDPLEPVAWAMLMVVVRGHYRCKTLRF